MTTEITPAEWLASREPKEIEAVLLSRVSRLGVGLHLKTEGRYPQGGGFYIVTTGCDVTGSLSQADAAAEIVRRTMVPAEQRDIEGWLAELSVIVARRQDDEFSEALRLEAYASRLRQYPADVARKAVLGTSWKFWPTWAELEKECKRLASPRQCMIRALEMVGEPEAPDAPRERVSAKKAADIMAEMGFTDEHAKAVSKRPMATSRKELDAVAEDKRVAHWTETCAPDDPRLGQLKAEREANPLIQAALRDQKKAEAS